MQSCVLKILAEVFENITGKGDGANSQHFLLFTRINEKYIPYFAHLLSVICTDAFQFYKSKTLVCEGSKLDKGACRVPYLETF